MKDYSSMTRPPNIILINCDDLGYGDLGCYGSRRNDTPHLDQLAVEGVRFTDFYMASPVCSASRAAMLTGCYSQRIGFADYQVLFPGQAQGLNPKESTIARQLKLVGYDTKIIGKWHCGDQPEFLPTNHGFDEYFGIPFSNDMGRQVNGLDRPPLPLMRNDEVIQQQPDQRGLTEWYVDESLQLMRRDRENPFFLYLAHMYVHVPLFVPKQFLDISRNGAYGGAVACIDWAMGMIEAELNRLGIKDETLVIFTSDNGSRALDEGGSNAPLRGTKAQTWEGGQRVPCIMRWPGKIAAGTTCGGIASSIDLYATLAELAGAPLPADTTLDSISLVEAILEGKATKRDTFAYYRGPNLEAVRKGDWKLHFCKIGWKPGGTDNQVLPELYNLRDDIAEANNVHDRHPEIVDEIEAAAEHFRQVFGDRRLDRVGTEIREVGLCKNPAPLTKYDENRSLHDRLLRSGRYADHVRVNMDSGKSELQNKPLLGLRGQTTYHKAEANAWSSAQAHCGMRSDPLRAPDFPPANVVTDWSKLLRAKDLDLTAAASATPALPRSTSVTRPGSSVPTCARS